MKRRHWFPAGVAAAMVALGGVAWTVRGNAAEESAMSAQPANTDGRGDASSNAINGSSETSPSIVATPAAYLTVGDVRPPLITAKFRGDVRPRNRSSLAFRRGGRVQSIMVREGEFAVAGQLLAVLDTADLEARSDAATARRDAAAAALDEATAGPRAERIEAAAAEVASLTAQQKSAENRLRRQRRLIQSDAGSVQQTEDAAFEVRRLNADRDRASAILRELQNGTRREQVAAARANLAVAEADRQSIVVDLRDSQILAPFDCVIAARMIDEGTVVIPGTPVLDVFQRPPMEARFRLTPAIAETLSLDDVVSVETTPGSIANATVVRIHPTIDRVSRTRTVDVQFQTDVAVVPGQSVQYVHRQSGGRHTHPSESIWLPTTALVRGSRGVWSVYVIEDDVLRRVAVQTGVTDGETTAVTGAIPIGGRVVASGTHRLAPGMTVRPVPWRSDAADVNR